MVVCLTLFFFNDTATTEIYTLSLHDALPILRMPARPPQWTVEGFARQLWRLRASLQTRHAGVYWGLTATEHSEDRKSTRLNSSHSQISYAVFCLKKKKHSSKWSTAWIQRDPH